MKKNLALIEARLKERKVEYKISFTEGFRCATKLTERLIADGATDIIVVGGDGTLHEVINGFSAFDKVALGLIPCGTGNDFARALRLPFKPVKALDLILDGKPLYTDYMQMPTVRALNIVGMGVDVDVLQLYEQLKKKTRFGYTKCLLKALKRFRYIHFNAEVDGDKKYYHSFIACVANGSCYGGGIRICPTADPTDNALDFVAIRAMKKFKIIPAFLKLKLGKILKQPYVIHKNMKEVKITDVDFDFVQVDGEIYKNIPFEVKLVSNELRFYRNEI